MAAHPSQQDSWARPSGGDSAGEESTGGNTTTSPTDTSSTPTPGEATAASAATPTRPRPTVLVRSHIHAYMGLNYGAAVPEAPRLTPHTLARLDQETLHGYHSIKGWIEAGSPFSLAAPANASESLFHDGRTEGAVWTATATQSSNVASSSAPPTQRERATNDICATGGQFDEAVAAPGQLDVDLDDM